MPRLFREIGIGSAIVIVLRWQLEGFLLSDHRRCGSQRTHTAAAQQVFHRFGIALVHILSDEVDGIAADSFVLMKPQVSSDGYLL